MKRAPIIDMTEREFRRQKRKELRALRVAMKEFNFGCAYLPPEAYKAFMRMDAAMNIIERQCKPWWRKA